MKILLITPENISNETSSGYLLRNLYSHYNTNNIAQIYFSHTNINFNNCKRFWKFSNKQFYYNIGRKVSNKSIKVENRKILSKYFIYLEPLIDMFPIRYTPNFYAWLDEFEPDIIYSWMGSKRIIDLTVHISKRNKIPIVIHFMDNWIEASVNKFYILRCIERKNLKNAINIINKYVSSGIVISQAMLKHYKSIFQIPLYVISNGVQDNLILDEFTQTPIKNNRYVFSLFGRLELGRLENLNFLINSLKTLEEYNFTINIYSDFEKLFTNTNNIKLNFYPTPNDSELAKIFSNTNFLIYLDGFKFSKQNEYFKYSFSGKIPIYLTCGKPILTIGPLSNYSIEYLQFCSIGPVVSEYDFQLLINSVKIMINYDYFELSRIFSNSRSILEDLKISNIQIRLFRILSNLINKHEN